LYEGRFYRSVELRRLDEQPEQIRAFIDALRSDGVIRWGGDFSTADPVHLDDGFFIRDQQAARQIWEQIEALQASARVRA
jgi:hypothetical protein